MQQPYVLLKQSVHFSKFEIKSLNAGHSVSNKSLIILCGYPGVGKTAIAHFLKECFSKTWIVSRYHFVKKHLFENNGRTKSESDRFHIDRRFYFEVRKHIARSKMLILDGTFHTRAKRQDAYRFARDNNMHPILIYCKCEDMKLLEKRLQLQFDKSRKNFFGCSVSEMLNKYFETFQKVAPLEEAVDTIEFDTVGHKPIIAYRKDEENTDALELIYNTLQRFWRYNHISHV